jgi:hypothetical protein
MQEASRLLALVLYLPIGHTAHVVVSPAKDPAPHTQPVKAEVPVPIVVENFGHFKHVLALIAPTVALYVSASHFLHTTFPLTFLNEPARHEIQDCDCASTALELSIQIATESRIIRLRPALFYTTRHVCGIYRPQACNAPSNLRTSQAATAEA